jgi:hypothetical protein
MATPAEKLAESLEALHTIQNSGMVAIKTDALTRTNRERLLANGFIKEIYKGWYIIVSPNETVSFPALCFISVLIQRPGINVICFSKVGLVTLVTELHRLNYSA